MIKKIENLYYYFLLELSNWRNKQKIKKLKKKLSSLDWIIGIEKCDDPKVLKAYKETETQIRLLEIMIW